MYKVILPDITVELIKYIDKEDKYIFRIDLDYGAESYRITQDQIDILPEDEDIKMRVSDAIDFLICCFNEMNGY